MKTPLSLLIVPTLILSVGPGASGSKLQAPVKIEGWVYDSGGNGLDGVQVTAEQQGVVRGPATTKDLGRYELTVPGGTPISNVTYDHSKFEPGVVPNLSDKQSHNISKILYRPGERRSAQAHVDQLAAYELLLVAAVGNTPNPRMLAMVQRIAIEKFVDLLPVDKIEQPRAKDILQRHKQLLVTEYQRFR